MNTEDDASWFYFTITDAKLIAKNFIDGMEEIVTASPCRIGFQCKQVPILFFVRFIFRKDDITSDGNLPLLIVYSVMFCQLCKPNIF